MIAARWASRRIISSVIALIMLDLKTALRVLVRLMMMQKLAMLLGQFFESHFDEFGLRPRAYQILSCTGYVVADCCPWLHDCEVLKR